MTYEPFEDRCDQCGCSPCPTPGYCSKNRADEQRRNGNGNGKGRPPPLPRMLSSAEFAASFQPPDYLVDGLIIRSYLYGLTGPTGSGKTSVMLLMAERIAREATFAGRETAKGRVLFLAAENPVDTMMRWIALAQQDDFDLADIEVFFIPGVFTISQMSQHLCSEALRIGGNFDLVVVDTGPAFYEGDEEDDRVQQQQHARMFRNLIEAIPGRPAIIVNVHPVKRAQPDDLIPSGGGTFLNEIDGNLCLHQVDGSCQLHWQGKLRGVDFAPIQFEIKTVTHERLKDKKGKLIPTVVASHIQDDAAEAKAKILAQDAVDVLQHLSDSPGTSFSAIAIALRWTLYNGDPNKMRVHRIVEALKKKKFVTTDLRNRLSVTPDGLAALARANAVTP